MVVEVAEVQASGKEISGVRKPMGDISRLIFPFKKLLKLLMKT